jgi:hypothetical protein
LAKKLFRVIIACPTGSKTVIRNKRKLEEFERKLDAEEKLSYREALAIYEAMHKEAVSLGIISSENILEGLEVDLRIARAINKVGSCRKGC